MILRRLKLPLLILLLLASAVFLISAGGKVRVVAKEAQGRSGPGSFYELKCLIPEGTILEFKEKKKSWCKVVYNNNEVWISENSISSGESASSKKTDEVVVNSKISITASPAVLTAAIKGFWTRYTGADKSKLTELPVNGYNIEPEYIESFCDKREAQVSRDILFKKYKLKSDYKSVSISYQKDQAIGFSIASSVADAPLVGTVKAVEYINAVGSYVAESTERYDTKFIFYVLDTDRINAVSCPGGYIVLTKGLVELFGNEAELAAVLAHEMAHLIAGHASVQMKENKAAITADSAFGALDKETGGGSETEDELIAVTNRAFQTAVKPKLDEQEYEADRLAVLYLARSGYDLEALPVFLNKMMEMHEKNIDIFDLNYRNHPDFKERMKRVQKEISKYYLYSGQNFMTDFKTEMVF
jgi:beta-barrel assembly-enhancing protease